MAGREKPSPAFRDNITELVEHPGYHGAIKQKIIGGLAYVCYPYQQEQFPE